MGQRLCSVVGLHDQRRAVRGNGRMIITVFRSRLDSDAQDEYGPMARQMSELVVAPPNLLNLNLPWIS
jgi:hypothetical protein